MGLARADKFAISRAAVTPLVLEFLGPRDIEIRDLPPAPETVALATAAADRYGTGRRRLNLGDCLHYACAKHQGMPILATGDESRRTDLETIP